MSVRGVHTNQTIAKQFKASRVLARGGFGTVYEAVDLKTRKKVALKMVYGKDETEAEVKREIALMEDLKGVSRMTQMIKGGKIRDEAGRKIYFLVLELAVGSLDFFLKENEKRGTTPPVSEKSVVCAGWHVLTALGELHARGIVHRDVKSANIFVFPEVPGKLKLGDFGLASYVVKNGVRCKPAASVAPFRFWNYGSPYMSRKGHQMSEIDDTFMLAFDLLRLHGCKVLEGGSFEKRMKWKEDLLQNPGAALPSSAAFLLPLFELLVQQPLGAPVDIVGMKKALKANHRMLRNPASIQFDKKYSPPRLI